MAAALQDRSPVRIPSSLVSHAIIQEQAFQSVGTWYSHVIASLKTVKANRQDAKLTMDTLETDRYRPMRSARIVHGALQAPDFVKYSAMPLSRRTFSQLLALPLLNFLAPAKFPSIDIPLQLTTPFAQYLLLRVMETSGIRAPISAYCYFEETGGILGYPNLPHPLGPMPVTLVQTIPHVITTQAVVHEILSRIKNMGRLCESVVPLIEKSLTRPYTNPLREPIFDAVRLALWNMIVNSFDPDNAAARVPIPSRLVEPEPRPGDKLIGEDPYFGRWRNWDGGIDKGKEWRRLSTVINVSETKAAKFVARMDLLRPTDILEIRKAILPRIRRILSDQNLIDEHNRPENFPEYNPGVIGSPRLEEPQRVALRTFIHQIEEEMSSSEDPRANRKIIKETAKKLMVRGRDTPPNPNIELRAPLSKILQLNNNRNSFVHHADSLAAIIKSTIAASLRWHRLLAIRGILPGSDSSSSERRLRPAA